MEGDGAPSVSVLVTTANRCMSHMNKEESGSQRYSKHRRRGKESDVRRNEETREKQILDNVAKATSCL